MRALVWPAIWSAWNCWRAVTAVLGTDLEAVVDKEDGAGGSMMEVAPVTALT